MIRCVDEALDCGITLFDTADIYGLGVSERNLAEGLGKRRSQAVIASKYGVRLANGKTFYDSSPNWFRTALEASLRRLKTDYLDLYQLHNWDGSTPLEVVAEEMERAKDQGKILCWGVTNQGNLEDYSKLFPTDGSFTFSYQLSLLSQDNEAVIREVAENFHKSVFFAWGSLAQGLLSGKFGDRLDIKENDRRRRSEYPNFHGEKYAYCRKVVEKLSEIAKTMGRTTTQVALRWILDGQKNSVALVGVRNRGQLQDNVGTAGWFLDQDLWAEIDGLTKGLNYQCSNF
jgi:aryl-alcohol dehydrogenase-like predicted oxidoreductase